ncbi:MAG TPA: carboxypeptidase-like regulatory domain-containing protein, partial [Armatimonadota bacterium]|nr:carboxypeptidase-like regulatory domain-containing protein [Armatimonadota bacterium]
RYTAVTDAQGQFTIPGLPEDGRVWALVDDRRFAKALIQLSLNSIKKNVVTVVPGATVRGCVVNDAGKPLAGIQVSISGGSMVSQETTTATDGSYSFSRLCAGRYHVYCRDPVNKLLFIGESIINIKNGTVNSINPITLVLGGSIEGTVMDEKNNPLAGSQIEISCEQMKLSPQARKTMGTKQYFSTNAETEPDGHFSARVIPGRYTVAITQPIGYTLTSPQTIHVTVGAGGKADCSFHCRAGMKLAGVATDGQGHPLPNIILYAKNAQELWRDDVPSFTTDAQGRFITPPLSDGAIYFTTARSVLTPVEWSVVSPAPDILPAGHPVTIILRRNPHGRVVTQTGDPMAGVDMLFKYQIKMPVRGENDFTDYQQGMVTTDTLGTFPLPECRPGTEMILLAAAKNGMRCLSLGAVTSNNGVLSVSDTVMVRCNATLHGTVVNAQGDPIAGAAVMSPDSTPLMRTTSDASGCFTLNNLPPCAVTVIAATRTAVASMQASTGVTPVTIPLLRATTPPIPCDLRRVTALLRADVQRPPEQRLLNHADTIALLAERNYQLACALAKEEGIALPDSANKAYITMLAHRDLHKAAQLGPTLLELIYTPLERCDAALLLGRALANTNHRVSEHCYALAAGILLQENHVEEIGRYVELIRLAAKLHHADVPAMITSALYTARSSDMTHMVGMIYLVQITIDPVQAERLWATMSRMERNTISWQLYEVFAQQDPRFARNLLAYINKKHQTKLTSPQLEAAEVQQMAAVNPEEALAYVKKRYDFTTVRALLTGMAQCTDAKRIQRVVHALSQLQQSKRLDGDNLAYITAALAFRVDPAYGTARFAGIKQSLIARYQREEHFDTWDDIWPWSMFAYQYSRVDPLECRMMLESSLARLANRPHNEDNGVWQYRNIALAMATIDPERALEITRMLGESDPEVQQSVARDIITYILASDNQRIVTDKW